MVVIFIAFFIVTGSSFCKSEQSDIKASSLYKDYTDIYLQELAQKEDDCRRSYLHFIGPKEHAPCYDLTIDRLRNIAAYAHQTAHATVKTDAKTYQEIGVKKLVNAVTTQLLMGKASFVAQLCSPITDTSHIKNIQAKQQFLENNVDMHNNLKHIIAQVKSGENALLDLWNEQECADVNKTLQPYDASYMPSIVQENVLMRNIKVGLKASKPYVAPLFLNVSMKGCGAWYNWYKNFDDNDKKASDQLVNGMALLYHNGLGSLTRIYDNFFSDWIGVFIGVVNISAFIWFLEKYTPSDNTTQSATHLRYVRALPYVGYSIDVMRNVYKLYEERSNDAETVVHQTLIDVANYMRAAETIYQTLQHNVEFNTHFPHFCKTYETLCTNEQTKSLMDNLLKTNTFTGSPSPFSNVGRIAVVSEQLMHFKQDIVPLMQAMGELDHYLSLVDFKKNSGHEIPFIYTEMVEATRASVYAENFKHPAFIDSKPNTISLGGDAALTTIITGPNGCGKSFATEALAINIVLSKTHGTAQAKHFSHVPMKEITYIATPSGKIGGNSRYQAEVETIGDVYEGNKIRAVAQEIGLYIIDEPLTATNAKAGAAGVEEYIQRVNAIPHNNNLRIIITHHDIQNMGDVQHYQVNDGEDKFILKPGRSNYSNALKLVLEELDRREKNWQFLD